MPCSPISRTLRWSLLAVPLACNLAVARAADAPAAAASASPTVEADPGFQLDLRKSVEYLASDELEGRGLGTKGLDKAADFIADAFKRLGLQPAPSATNYFQPFTITAATAADPKTALTVGDKVFALNEDFSVVGLSAEGQFDGPVVFAGYGVTSPEHGYDDYAGLDVKGKVVLVLRYEPHDAAGVSRFTGKQGEWSPQASLATKARLAKQHGAAALLLVNPPAHHGDADEVMAWQSMGGEGPVPFLHVKRHVAEQLLKRGGAKDLAALQREIDGPGKPLAHALPNVTAAGQVKILRTDTHVKNVVGVLPGSGDLAGEYVVVGSHYDHLGHGGPGSFNPTLREIHNGADDNASGTSAMLELAEDYAKRYREAAPGASARSILFIAFTAEETGLVGSQHFVNNAPVRLDKIAYMLNLDMVGRISNDTLQIGGTGTAASFEALLKRADEASPLKLTTFSKGGFGPSDHMSFAMKQIPVLFFWSGTHSDYHRPSDDADKINYEGIEQVIALGSTVLDAMTTTPRETYVATSDDPHGGMAPGSGRGGSGVTLGVVPHYGEDDGKGVRIDGTSPGTPAAAAGLKAGDVIVKFNDEDLKSLQGLTDVLRRSKPGEKVKLVVVRDGKNVEFDVTLAARK